MIGLALLLLLTLGLRMWHLDRNNYGHPYYAATVRSMLMSWHHFFYASFDPAGFLTVDKPPVAFWIQTAAAHLLGFRGFSIHLPQALEGAAAVWLVYLIVRRAHGAGAGLLAGLILALMPVSTAVDRSNLPDSCLVFFLLLAARALLRAVENGRIGSLLAAMALVGVAFNVKLMAALVVLPTFFLMYLLGAPVGRRRRVLHLTAASVVLAAVALSWSMAVDLTPADRRPYVGDTQDNSMLTMAVGTSGPFSGIGRAVGGGPGPDRDRPPRPGDRAGGPPGPPDAPRAGPPPPGGMAPPGPPGDRPPHRGGPFMPARQMIGFGGPPGPFRLLEMHMAEQFAWLLPLAVLGAPVAVFAARRPGSVDRAGGNAEAVARQARVRYVSVLLWTGWMVSYLAVLSAMQGVIHNYYLTLVAPAVAALAGIGLATLGAWAVRHRAAGLLLFGAALAATAVWQMFMLRNHPDWERWLLPLLRVGVLLAVGLLLAVRVLRNRLPHSSRLAPFAFAAGLAAVLLSPAAWALTPVLARGHPALPMAYPELLTGGGIPEPLVHPPDHTLLIEYLRANRRNERYLLVTPEIHTAAPLIIESGEPIIALGGFTGRDPTLTADAFARLAAEGQVRFVMASPFPGGPRGGVGDVFEWVRRNGRPVPPRLWRPPRAPGAGREPQDLPPPFGSRPGPDGETPPPRREGPGQAGPPAGGRRPMPGPGGPMTLFDCRP